MKTSIPWRAASVVTIVLALGGRGLVEPTDRKETTRVSGEISDYTAVLDPGGPWHVTGQWTVWLRGESRSAEADRSRAGNAA